jgi:uncharacterized protein with PIN domain
MKEAIRKDNKGSMKEAVMVCPCCKEKVVGDITVPVKVSSSDVDVRTVYVCPRCRDKYNDDEFEEMLGSV